MGWGALGPPWDLDSCEYRKSPDGKPFFDVWAIVHKGSLRLPADCRPAEATSVHSRAYMIALYAFHMETIRKNYSNTAARALAHYCECVEAKALGLQLRKTIHPDEPDWVPLKRRTKTKSSAFAFAVHAAWKAKTLAWQEMSGIAATLLSLDRLGDLAEMLRESVIAAEKAVEKLADSSLQAGTQPLLTAFLR